MRKSRIISLGGYAGSGKDYAGWHLEALGYQRVKFADPLYKIAAVLCGLGPYDLTTDAAKQWFKESWHWMRTPIPWLKVPVKGRWILQWLGTDIVRKADQDLWIARAAWEMRNPGRYAVTDARFRNEVRMIRELGGVWWRVHSTKASKPAMQHPSETEQDRIAADLILHNNHDTYFVDLVLRKALEHEARITKEEDR